MPAKKTDLPPIPSVLADVAMIDGRTIASAAGVSISAFLDGVRRTAAGQLESVEVPYPQPVIRQPRCTRWRLIDVRAWLIERASAGTAPQIIDRTRALAKRASAAAQAKRQAEKVGA